MARRILLTGGGTGGHVYPALAIAQALRGAPSGASLLYLGIKGGIEETIARSHQIPFHGVISAPYPGMGRLVAFCLFAMRLALRTLMALGYLMRHRPHIVVATGGYVAAPAVFAAVLLRTLRLLRVKVFVHEQNIRPGRLNSLVGRFADVVGLSFPGSAVHMEGARCQHVGYPVRDALRQQTPSSSPSPPPPPSPSGQTKTSPVLAGIPEGKRILLAFGGSQGARTINRAVADALPLLQDMDDLFIIHGIGKSPIGGYDPAADTNGRIGRLVSSGTLHRPLAEFYRQVPYMEQMGEVYGAASLVVCRGGAGTIKELCAVGRPAIILPKAGLAGDHQVLNGLALEEAGGAVVLLEEPLVDEEGQLLASVPGARLAETASHLLKDSDRLKRMAHATRALDDPDALDRILRALGVIPEPEDASSLSSDPEPRTAPVATTSPTCSNAHLESHAPILTVGRLSDNGNGNGNRASTNGCDAPPPSGAPKSAHGQQACSTRPWHERLWPTPATCCSSSPELEDLPVSNLAELGPTQLLDLARCWASQKSRSAPGTNHPHLHSLPYLRYRAASLLVAPGWQARNIGIKLVGLLGLDSLLPTVRHIYEDPAPDSLMARLCGGDRVQNGFIRRNTLEAIIQLKQVSPNTEAMVRSGLEDRYFEARRVACHAVRLLGRPLCTRQWAVEGIRRCLKDPSFEVRMAAIRAVEKTMPVEEGLALLRRFTMDPNWQLRNAVLLVFEGWAKAGNPEVRTLLAKELKHFLLTAGGYRPIFGLKENARRVAILLSDETEKEGIKV